MIIYLTGKYYGNNWQEIEDNISVAKVISVRLWNLGYTVICPHLNTAHFDDYCQNVTYEEWIFKYMSVLELCDSLVLMPYYHLDESVKLVKQWAEYKNIPVYEYPNLPLLLKNAGKA